MMNAAKSSQPPEVTFSSDASGRWGCGAVWQDAWLQVQWNRQWQDQQIAAKELVPIVLACAIWGPTVEEPESIGTMRQHGSGACDFDPAKHLTPQDIAVDIQNPSMIKVHLKCLKTDQIRAEVDLYIGRTHNSLCPVVAMLKYLSMRGMDSGPLFSLQGGSPLTRQGLVEKVRELLRSAGVDPTHYSGHSFRIGAATTAAAQGVSDATIQLLQG